MDEKLQRRVQRYGWDKSSDRYETYWKTQLIPAQNQTMIMADFQTRQSVIELAAGTGLVTFRIAEAVGSEGHVLATDISQGMLDQAQLAANERSIGNVTFERCGAEDLLYEDNRFDRAICALGLMYVPNPLLAIQEMHRVLRSGGKAISAVWGERKNCGWASIFPIVESHVQSDVCPMFFQLGTKDVQEKYFIKAGFEAVESCRISTVLFFENAEDACGAAFDGGPVAMASDRFDEQTRQQANAEYLDSVEAYRTDAGYEIPGEFVITVGTKS